MKKIVMAIVIGVLCVIALNMGVWNKTAEKENELNTRIEKLEKAIELKNFIEETKEEPKEEETKVIYDVVETYDNTMIIETENGTEKLTFNGMTEAEKYAEKVIFENGEYVGIAE